MSPVGVSGYGDETHFRGRMGLKICSGLLVYKGGKGKWTFIEVFVGLVVQEHKNSFMVHNNMTTLFSYYTYLVIFKHRNILSESAMAIAALLLRFVHWFNRKCSL